jgi:hypothetical protein
MGRGGGGCGGVSDGPGTWWGGGWGASRGVSGQPGNLATWRAGGPGPGAGAPGSRIGVVDRGRYS